MTAGFSFASSWLVAGITRNSLHQLGPDALPAFWSQHLSCNHAIRRHLHLNSLGRFHFSETSHALVQVRLTQPQPFCPNPALFRCECLFHAGKCSVSLPPFERIATKNYAQRFSVVLRLCYDEGFVRRGSCRPLQTRRWRSRGRKQHRVVCCNHQTDHLGSEAAFRQIAWRWACSGDTAV